MNKLKKIIFLIPPYHQSSNGIKVLYEAAYLFSKVIATRILIFNIKTSSIIKLSTKEQLSIPVKYKFLYTNNSLEAEGCVCIYPEVLIDDPLPYIQKKIIRYFLAKPYILNGQSPDFINDYCISYSNIINKNLPQLFILDESLRDLGKINITKRNKVSVYFGKYRTRSINYSKKINQLIDLFDEVKIITRLEPKSKNKLYTEIASSKLIISYDGFTSLIYESILLGTPCLVLDNLFKNEMESFNIKLFDIYFNHDIEMLYKVFSANFNLKDHRGKNTQIYEKSLLKQREAVVKIIQLAENFFSNPKKEKLDKNAERNRKEKLSFSTFYRQKWKGRPILNIRNKKRILLILLVNYSPYLYEKFLVIVYSIKSRKWVGVIQGLLINPFSLKINARLYFLIKYSFFLAFQLKIEERKIVKLVNSSLKRVNETP